MLNFLGPAVPVIVGTFLNPQRMGLIARAVIEGVQFVQALIKREHGETDQAYQARRKKEAREFAWASYDLAVHVRGHSLEVDQYVYHTLIPAMVDGLLLAFNAAMWFATDKPVQVGGAHAPTPQGLAYANGTLPQTPMPMPLELPSVQINPSPATGGACAGAAQCQQ